MPSSSPEVWFAIPSANPEKCRKVLPKWREMGYKIAVLQNHERGDIPTDLTVWFDSYPGWAASVNILCQQIVPESCPIVVSGGDDMLPDPNHTAQELGRQFLERFPDTFGVMQPHGDEFMVARRYCGSPFIGRAWFSTMYNGKGAMYSGYRHNWADNELYWLAKGLGVLWERPDLSHFHDHFTRRGEEKPGYWQEQVEARDLADCQMYINRSWSRFPGHQPARLMHDANGRPRVFDSSVLAQGAMHLAEIRMAQMTYIEGGRAAWMLAMRGALDELAKRGVGPIAVYGSGTHTRGVSDVLAASPVPIDCIIDDNESRQGQRLWNWPIVSIEEAIERGVRGVVLSANMHEHSMWDNATPFFEHNIPVQRLYPASHQERSARMETALEMLHRHGVARLGIAGVETAHLEQTSWFESFADRFECVISTTRDSGASSVFGARAVSVEQALKMGLHAVIDADARRPLGMPADYVARFERSGVPVLWMHLPKPMVRMPRHALGAVA
ncbi:MAG: hypothetical protein AB7Q00_01045 [Phycisphaerales bacterium]